MVGAVLLLATCVFQILISSMQDAFAIYEGANILILTSAGIIFTASTTLAMSEGREYIGSASAIFGSMGFLFGGIVSPLVGIGNITHSTIIATGVCAVLILVLAFIAMKRK